jgi:hypothetical protein
MGGWPRIGVVISVLWALAVPTHLMIVTNQEAGDYYRRCIERAGIASGSFKQEDFTKDMQRCSTELGGMLLTPAGAVRTLLFQESSDLGQALWGIILVPIAIFWIVFATLRWIGRGFSAARK